MVCPSRAAPRGTLYAAEGSAGITNRRIGEQADTTTQAIYTYCGSQDALIEAISRFGRSGTGEQTADDQARIHMTVAALHGFFEAEIPGFINESHEPDRLFDELVHRCLAPFDQIPSTW